MEQKLVKDPVLFLEKHGTVYCFPDGWPEEENYWNEAKLVSEEDMFSGTSYLS